RRNRLKVVTASLAALALVIGLLVAMLGLVEARREADRSQAIADFLQDVLLSSDPEQALHHDVDAAGAVATAREVFGDDHATVAAALSSRAIQLAGAGNYAAAEPLHKESIRIWKEVHGPDHLNVGMAYGRLGTLLRRKGDDQGAEEAFRESLRITQAQPGGPSIVTANTLNGLAEVLLNRGAYAEGIALLRESLAIRRAVAPHQRLEIAMILNAIAQTMTAMGKVTEAEPVVRETLEAFRRALPARSHTFAKVLVQVGSYYYEQGDYEQAESLLREGVDIYRDSDTDMVLYRDIGLTLLARTVSQKDDESDAYVAVRKRFLAYVRSIVGDKHDLLGQLLTGYSGYMCRHGLPAEGVAMAAEAVGIVEATGTDPKRMERSLEAVAECTWELAKEKERPAGEYEAALRGIETYLAKKPDEPGGRRTLAVLQHRLGLTDEARATLERLQGDTCCFEEARQLMEER
ncbi:MAG: tetratricopeptide repeat protein, partial [Planctomycetota bacterium]